MSTAAPPAPAPPVAEEAETADGTADAAADVDAPPEVIEGTIGEVLTLPSLCMECFKNVRRTERARGGGGGLGGERGPGGGRLREARARG